MMPSVTPNTTTRSHSRPLTRWIVESGDAARVALALERRAQPRLERRPGRGGGRRRRAAPRGRRGGSTPAPPPVRSSRLIAEPRPTSSRTTSRTSRVVPAPAGVDDERGGRRRGRAPCRVLVGHLVGERRAARRASTPCAGRAARGTTAAAPLGRRRISTRSAAAQSVRVDWRCAGRRARPAARCGSGRPGEDRAHRDPGLVRARRAGRAAASSPGRARRSTPARRPARPATRDARRRSPSAPSSAPCSTTRSAPGGRVGRRAGTISLATRRWL